MNWIKGISPIAFPGLGIEIDPAVGFSVGPLTVNFYGAIIALGLILAVVYAWKRSHQFGIKADDITDAVLYVVPFAVLCARAYYCVFQWETFADDPISVLYIWQGGLAIYGGVLGAVVGVAVYCYFKKIKLPALLDLVALGFLIGQCLGRWGNFFNREAYGAETEFFLRMGLMLTPDRYSSTEMFFYHPTFLYESLWNLTGFILICFLYRKKKFNGQVALMYLSWYGFGRMFIEGLRTDSLYVGPFRISQVVGAVCFIVGTMLIVAGLILVSKGKLDKWLTVRWAEPAPAVGESLTEEIVESADTEASAETAAETDTETGTESEAPPADETRTTDTDTDTQ